MNIKERVELLRSLKKEFLEKQALLKRLREQSSVTNLAKLLENDLGQAKLILAAQDVCDRLQKIAEHLAELGAEEIMPLSDSMKGAFGPEAAANFEHAANSNIQNALETVRAAKDSINAAILQVEGKMAPQNDMSQDTGAEPPNDMATYSDNGTPPADDGSAQPAADDFGGADAAAGPNNEPLGRSRKESYQNSNSLLRDKKSATLANEGKSFKRNDDVDDDTTVEYKRKNAKDKQNKRKDKNKDDINETINFAKTGRKILETVSIDKLVSWILSEATKTLQGDKFLKFTQDITAKAIKMPEATAGWIGVKRWGAPAMRKLVESDHVSPRADKLATAIGKVIETNVMVFGKGKAAQVVESFTGDLMEADGSDVLEAFDRTYGCSPAMYSLRLAKQMQEDGTITPMDPDEKTKVTAAVGQLASKIATNPSLANQPVATGISTLDPNSQSALQQIAGDKSAGTVQNVGQLINAANDKVNPDDSEMQEARGKQANVFAEIRAMGLLIKKDEFGDYIVNYKNYAPGEGYHTDDLDDALDTAKAMARKMPDLDEAKKTRKTTSPVKKANTVHKKPTLNRMRAYEEEIKGYLADKEERDRQRVKHAKKTNGKVIDSPLPQAQPGTKKYRAKSRDTVVEDDDVVSQVRNTVLDIITPLESQGITSITFNQIKDQLQDDPRFQSMNITDDLISQAIDGISGINAAPDMANNQQMTITFSNTSQSPEAHTQTVKGQNNIDQAAKRQANKDLA